MTTLARYLPEIIKAAKQETNTPLKRTLVFSTALTLSWAGYQVLQRALLYREEQKLSEAEVAKIKQRHGAEAAAHALKFFQGTQSWSSSIVWRVLAWGLMVAMGGMYEGWAERNRIPVRQATKLIPRFFPDILQQLLKKLNYRFWRSVIGFILLVTTATATRGQPLPYCAAFLVPIITFISTIRGRLYSLLYGVFLAFPLIEMIQGVDRTNPTQAEAIELNHNKFFKLIPMIWVPFQLLLLSWACWAASVFPFTLPQFLVFAATIGINTGVLGINISHELIHKNDWLEQLCGKVLLSSVCYGHWYVEHLDGHHRMVSTPHDPATSRFNEVFYSFWWRSVSGSWISAWQLERAKLQKEKLPFWCPENRILQMSAGSLAMAAAIYKLFGIKGLALFLTQSFVAFSLLEVVNYIEHYGLARDALPSDEAGSGSYEPVNPTHSWNSDARVTNMLLFKLQRHSDHHAYASRRYQILRSFPESPQMPTGYAGMITLALFPPIWFRVMNPRLEEWKRLKQEAKAKAAREAPATSPLPQAHSSEST